MDDFDAESDYPDNGTTEENKESTTKNGTDDRRKDEERGKNREKGSGRGRDNGGVGRGDKIGRSWHTDGLRQGKSHPFRYYM